MLELEVEELLVEDVKVVLDVKDSDVLLVKDVEEVLDNHRSRGQPKSHAIQVAEDPRSKRRRSCLAGGT